MLSSRAVGSKNRAYVLRTLVDHGPLSRSDLARMAGVTRATIGSIVQGLLEDEILEERGPVDDGQVGKPARPLWFAAGAGSVVAIELSSAGARGALVDARGSVYADEFAAFGDPASAPDVLGVTGRLAASLSERRSVLGVGIAVPGATNIATGEVIGSVQVPGAEGHALVREVHRSTDLPTFAENDARAQALAEHWFGSARGLGTFTSVQTGAGLSVGLVLDGSVYRGPDGMAGELGHTAVESHGERCTCGLRGCWETVASLRWLRQAAKDAGIRGARTMDCARLAVLATDGDAAARELLETYAERLAIGLANLRSLLGSDYFILHGDAVGGGEMFRMMVDEATNSRALGPVRVDVTELGDLATILGSVAVVLSELLHVPT